MNTITETRVLPCTQSQLFALVEDVERYPEFLPFWCDARVARRTHNGYHTDQQIGIGLWRERFRTKTVLQPPERIDVVSKDGVLGNFTIRWTFEATTDGGCRIDFLQEYERNGTVFPWFWKMRSEVWHETPWGPSRGAPTSCTVRPHVGMLA